MATFIIENYFEEEIRKVDSYSYSEILVAAAQARGHCWLCEACCLSSLQNGKLLVAERLCAASASKPGKPKKMHPERAICVPKHVLFWAKRPSFLDTFGGQAFSRALTFPIIGYLALESWHLQKCGTGNPEPQALYALLNP